jgi:hypothetical protein
MWQLFYLAGWNIYHPWGEVSPGRVAPDQKAVSSVWFAFENVPSGHGEGIAALLSFIKAKLSAGLKARSPTRDGARE